VNRAEPIVTGANEKAERRPSRRARGAAEGVDFAERFDPAARQPELRPIVQLLRVTNVAISRFYHHTNVRAAHRLPRRGAGIVVCNHISGLDPLLIQSACQRAIVWMMAKEYYQIRPIHWFLRQIDAIPVERSGRDLAAMRAAMRALQAGRMLGVFPEGRIATGRELLPFQTGVALMAIKVGVPIYPAYVEGTQRGKTMVDAFKQRNSAVVAFGKPFRLPQQSTGRAELEAATAIIKRSVEALRDRYSQSPPH
jgi:1-acyl-sn-glycerol-3-phosphate acyltransferase